MRQLREREWGEFICYITTNISLTDLDSLWSVNNTSIFFNLHFDVFFRYNVCSHCIIRSFRDSVSLCYLQQYLQCYSGLDAWVLLPFDVSNNPHPNILNDVSCIYNTSEIMMIIIIIIAIRKFSNLIGYQLP